MQFACFKSWWENDFGLSVKIIEATYAKDQELARSLIGIALASREFSEEDVKICANIPNFVDYIGTGMGVVATNNAIRCHLSNGVRIEKLVLYDQSSSVLRESVDKITVFLNIANIHEMRTDILDAYLLSHAYSYGKVDDILNYGQIDARTIEIIVDKLDELEGDKYDDALMNIYKKARHFSVAITPVQACHIVSALSGEMIEQYIVDNCAEKQEVIDILKASRMKEFVKINVPQKIIKIENTKIGRDFAIKLEELGLVRIIKKKNDEYLKFDEIKLKVL